MSSHHMLADALEAAAFLTALDLKQAGGPTPEQHDQARADLTAAPYADTLMFGGPTDDLSATFTATANALAVLSFAPGGVKFAGRRLNHSGVPYED